MLSFDMVFEVIVTLASGVAIWGYRRLVKDLASAQKQSMNSEKRVFELEKRLAVHEKSVEKQNADIERSLEQSKEHYDKFKLSDERFSKIEAELAVMNEKIDTILSILKKSES